MANGSWQDSCTCWHSCHWSPGCRLGNDGQVTLIDAPRRSLPTGLDRRAGAALGLGGRRRHLRDHARRGRVPLRPGVLMDPLHMEFGWSHGTIGSAMSVNMMLFGLISPFAAALMDRFGIRPVVTVGAGAGRRRQRADRVHDRGLAAGAVLGRAGRRRHRLDVDGLRRHRRDPLVRRPTRPGQRHPHRGQRHRPADLPAGRRRRSPTHHGWRPAALTVAAGRAGRGPAGAARACATTRTTWAFRLTARPKPTRARLPHRASGSSAKVALRALPARRRTRVFWLLAGSFAICGATTNGLIGTHFIPAAKDHGMPVDHRGRPARPGRGVRRGRHDRLRLVDRPVRPDHAAAGLLPGPRAVAAGAARRCCRRTPSRAPGCSSSSTAWTGWRPCRRRWRCAASTSARAGADRVRLGVRRAPARRGGRRRRGRSDPRPRRAPTTWPSTWPRCSACSRPPAACGPVAAGWVDRGQLSALPHVASA